MEFRTKREAEEAVNDMERRARSADVRASMYAVVDRRGVEEGQRAYEARKEAARIRALLPTLPE